LKVLITGSTAFAGSHLADYLVENNLAEVHGTRRPRSRDEFVNKGVTYHELDVTDYSGVAMLLRKLDPDIVFHLAAQSYVPLSWKAPWGTIETNVRGTNTFLEAIRNNELKTTLQIACSSEEYGMVHEDECPIKETNPLRPMSPYGVSKVACDMLGYQYHLSYGINVVVTRAFNHTGPRRGEVFATSTFAKQIAEIEKGQKDPIIDVGNLSARRDFTDVRDTVKGYWLAAKYCNPGESYNICSGHAVSIEWVLETLLSFSDIEVAVRQDPERMRPSDVPLLLGDCTKFKQASGWEPKHNLKQTLNDLLDYWRERL